MSKTKKVLALVLSLLMLLALLAACGADKTEPAKEDEKKEDTKPADDKKEDTKPADDEKKDDGEKKIHAICIQQDSGGAAWGEARKSFIRGAEAKGWDWEFIAPTEVNSEPAMITLAETAVTKGCDVICGTVLHADVWYDVCTRAREKGIVWVAYPLEPLVEDSGIDTHDIINAYVGFNADAVVRLEAQQMAKVIPEDVKIYAMMFHQGVSDMTLIYYDALCDELTKLRPDTVMLGLEADENKPSITADKIAAKKLANPELNCVFGMDMGTALGIHNYIQENNLKGKMWGIGVDASDENLGTIKAGTVSFIIEQGYSRFGELAVDIADKILKGEDYSFDNEGVMTVIGPDNVDAFAEEMGLTIAEL